VDCGKGGRSGQLAWRHGSGVYGRYRSFDLADTAVFWQLHLHVEVIHLKTLALKVKDSGITNLIPAKIRMITITTPMMINVAVPT
jgi:hypothetical protein